MYLEKDKSEEEIICYCSNVTKEQIITALENGAKNLNDIRRMTGACTKGKCKELSPRKTCCSPLILQIISEYQEQNKSL